MSKKIKKQVTIELKSASSTTRIHKSFSKEFINNNGKKVTLKLFDKITRKREDFTGKA